MVEKISREARGEVLQAVQERYRQATRKEKARILDEVVALTNCHRKHAIRLLALPPQACDPSACQGPETRITIDTRWQARVRRSGS